jgi:hypothetical protein
MNTLHMKYYRHLLAWALASASLILAVVVTMISAMNPTTPGSQVHEPGSLPQTPAIQAAPLLPDCQSLPECGSIRVHAIDQNLVGSGPVGQMSAPVLTPACDALPECGYIRAHIQAGAATQP